MTFSPKRTRLLSRAAALVASVTAGWDGCGESSALTVTRRDIALPGWPEHAAGLTLGQLADFHGDSPAALQRSQRAVQMLLAEKPDVVCLTGDFLTDNPDRWAEPMARALAPLAQVPNGVFAVLGNHDWWSGGRWEMAQHLAETGFHVLDNQAMPLASVPGVWMVGLDSLCVGASDLPKALQGVPADAAKILLVHEPDFADLVPTGVNNPGFLLQLSGHSHAGQVRVPGLRPLHCPRWSRHYPEGWQPSPAHPVYTTRGVGMASVKLRLFCPPEVVVLRLLPAA